jgi:D-beta-D-heptose 7-phosphate kinase/D-beta-D-heptose 1-phosphate adenosyltransferase
LRLDAEQLPPDIARRRVVDEALAALPDAQCVVLSDYAKGALTPWGTSELIEAARAKGIPVYVDPKGPDWSGYEGATMLTPNLAEVRQQFGQQWAGVDPADGGFTRRAEDLCRSLNVQYILITLGPDGMALFSADSKNFSPKKSVKKQVFDVTGAGDTVLAVMAMRHKMISSVETTMEIASAAAGLVVGQIGTYAPNLCETMEEWEKNFRTAVKDET